MTPRNALKTNLALWTVCEPWCEPDEKFPAVLLARHVWLIPHKEGRNTIPYHHVQRDSWTQPQCASRSKARASRNKIKINIEGHLGYECPKFWKNKLRIFTAMMQQSVFHKNKSYRSNRGPQPKSLVTKLLSPRSHWPTLHTVQSHQSVGPLFRWTWPARRRYAPPAPFIH